MKKLLALTLALVLALALCACGGGTDTPADDTATDGTTVEIPPVEDLTATDTSAIPGVEDGVLSVGMECTYAPYNWTQATAAAAPAAAGSDVPAGLEDGVLTIAMECAYAPYNWTQTDDSNGAEPIVNNPGSYANGYDVMIAKRICETYGWDLEVYAIDWGALSPALAAGTIDMVIAGQSMTATRMQEVDMAGPYYYASIVCVVKDNSPLVDAKGLSDMTGTCTAQSSTIWYDSCLPQIEGAQIQGPAESAPAMIMAVESGTCDFICTDYPTAMGACRTYPDLKILDFAGSGDDFDVPQEEIDIGVSVKKGNTELADAAATVLAPLNADIFNAIMDQAIAIQPTV